MFQNTLKENAVETNATSNLSEDNFMVGVILAGKSIAQSVFNCFIGTSLKPKIGLVTLRTFKCILGALTAKFGYQRPMFFGFVMTIASTISFAFADTPVLMLISRSLQGVGTSFRYVHRFWKNKVENLAPFPVWGF